MTIYHKHHEDDDGTREHFPVPKTVLAALGFGLFYMFVGAPHWAALCGLFAVFGGVLWAFKVLEDTSQRQDNPDKPDYDEGG